MWIAALVHRLSRKVTLLRFGPSCIHSMCSGVIVPAAIISFTTGLSASGNSAKLQVMVPGRVTATQSDSAVVRPFW